MKKQIIVIGAVLALTIGGASAQGTFGVPYNQAGTPLADQYAQTLQANGGDVVVTYVHGITFGDHDIMSLNGVTIFDNHVNSPGNTYDLGDIAAGTVLNFQMQDLNPSALNTWSMGAGSVNADGHVHAYVADGYPAVGSSFVGWEDRPSGQADWNYNDLTFSFANTTAVVPEPGSFALAGMGLAVLFIFRRRKATAKVLALLACIGITAVSAQAQGTFRVSIPAGSGVFSDGGSLSGYADLSYTGTPSAPGLLTLVDGDFTTTAGSRFPGVEYRWNVAGESDTVTSAQVNYGSGWYVMLWDTHADRSQELDIPWQGIVDTSAIYMNNGGWTMESPGWNEEYVAGTGIRGFAVTAVPEPSSMALSVMGGLGLLAWRQRSRKQAA